MCEHIANVQSYMKSTTWYLTSFKISQLKIKQYACVWLVITVQPPVWVELKCVNIEQKNRYIPHVFRSKLFSLIPNICIFQLNTAETQRVFNFETRLLQRRAVASRLN